MYIICDWVVHFKSLKEQFDIFSRKLDEKKDTHDCVLLSQNVPFKDLNCASELQIILVYTSLLLRIKI